MNLELVQGEKVSHYAEDIGPMWKRHMRPLCGTCGGNLPAVRKGQKPACKLCIRVLRRLIAELEGGGT